MAHHRMTLPAVLFGFFILVSEAHAEEQRDGLITRICGATKVTLYQVHGVYGSVAFQVDPAAPDAAAEKAAEWHNFILGRGGLIDSLLLEWYGQEVECAERSKVATKAARTREDRDAAKALALHFLDPAIFKQAARERKLEKRSGEPRYAISSKVARRIDLELYTRLDFFQAIAQTDRGLVSGSIDLLSKSHIPDSRQTVDVKICLFESDIVNRVRMAELIVDFTMQLYGKSAGIRKAAATQEAKSHWLRQGLITFYGARVVFPKLGFYVWASRIWRGNPPLTMILDLGVTNNGVVPVMFRMLREDDPDVYWRLVSIGLGFGDEPGTPGISMDTLRRILAAEDQEAWALWVGKFRNWIQTDLRADEQQYKEIGELWKKECARVP
jgi:hypothetical protein